MKKIIFIHTLNNFTGSPNVLSVVIKGFVDKGYKVDLITSRGKGFLSNMEGVNYLYTSYRWLSSKWKTAFLLLLSQLEVFFIVLFASNQSAIYYLNTITPIGAAWACRLSRKKYIYHVHENMQQRKSVYALFRWTYKYCNQKSIFVSYYLKNTAVNCREGLVIHNGLDSNFTHRASEYLAQGINKKRIILMVASLRRYKGIYEFVKLAKENPKYLFELVLSATEEEVFLFSVETKIPINLTIYSSQNDMHLFYQRSRLLLQLSHPTQWVETFGLTILEAMTYGTPAIVPNVGGPTELVEDGENGYWVNPHDINGISSKIKNLMENKEIYRLFSSNALKKSKQFSEEIMVTEIEKYIR